MELKRGQVVKSRAGRDKDSYMAVLELDPPWVVLADGKKRPVERPKRKKLMHISPTLIVLSEEALATNRKLRAALREAGGQGENTPYDAEV
ncbi:MAG: hypothetical protein HFE91_08725 [Acutalibacter sp.]|jgi:ribosomal protein L14E/L6E/L27E|uniref:KOW domain-containing RNA-binding protein n=1 Tax=Acutalibacter sp. TaxID=1918636 RepID=UPI0021749A78|nr:KOW domain-containing RNA-binding protein [Acutalibacter sp.]MCI9225540.1 hypothetical protein [Acutalibacter sp.]